MKITELNIFPVKSLGGYSVSSSFLTPKGLEYDRNWMLLDENGRFMTQRAFPEMALLVAEIKEGQLVFTHREKDLLTSIPLQTKYSENIPSKVWSNDCEVQKVGTGIDDWLTAALDKKCHLVYFPKENIRTKGAQKNVASLADKSPLLITNEASLAELNSRLDMAIPMNRFRANIVCRGSQAFEEDLWKSIQVNSVSLPIVEQCGRCPLINVNQITSEKGLEPLQTLTKYRQDLEDGQIKFGLRVGVELTDKPMLISVGEELLVA